MRSYIRYLKLVWEDWKEGFWIDNISDVIWFLFCKRIGCKYAYYQDIYGVEKITCKRCGCYQVIQK